MWPPQAGFLSPDDAVEMFERLLSARNDLGLLTEEYDPTTRGQLGNFPHGFSHIAFVNKAFHLVHASGPAKQRAQRDAPASADQSAKSSSR